MDDIRNQLFARLGESFGELGIEYKTVDGAGEPQIGDGLMAMVPVTGTDGQIALMEIAFAKFGEGMNFLQLYSTVVMECNQSLDVLLQAVNEVNFYCPIGSFGVFREQGQMYHKHCIILDDGADAESIADDTLTAFHAVLLILAYRAPLLSKLALGEIDLETAAQQGLFS